MRERKKGRNLKHFSRCEHITWPIKQGCVLNFEMSFSLFLNSQFKFDAIVRAVSSVARIFYTRHRYFKRDLKNKKIKKNSFIKTFIHYNIGWACLFFFYIFVQSKYKFISCMCIVGSTWKGNMYSVFVAQA